ncbi:vesicular glutamate transporter 1 [Plakobranchus ocellatus]|uniref:Vesicular glutamate transporter 1 n=1 Tax=Plakobranchus ocellatus TaxID=259542 RepID=A0AAV4DM80_9GAST|nr:vesicular glutamate transporter 1 [Plakobranchus ocellatus]
MKVGPRVEFTELDPKPELPALGVKFGSKAETKIKKCMFLVIDRGMEVVSGTQTYSLVRERKLSVYLVEIEMQTINKVSSVHHSAICERGDNSAAVSSPGMDLPEYTRLIHRHNGSVFSGLKTSVSKISVFDHWSGLVSCLPARYVLALWSFLGFINMFTLRTDMNIAILAMVNDTNSTVQGSLQEESRDREKFSWSETQQSLVLSAFYYGYCSTQVLGGYLSGLVGAKLVMGYGLLSTSVLTLLTPLAAVESYYLLVACRVGQGIGQGLAQPCMHTLWSKWAPETEKSKLLAITFCGKDLFVGVYTGWRQADLRIVGIRGRFEPLLRGCQLGTVLVTWASGIVCQQGLLGGWTFVFYLFGSAGVLWSIGWLMVVFESPAVHPRISPGERQYIEESRHRGDTSATPKDVKQPLWKIVLSPAFTAIVFAHFANDWGCFALTTCLPSFLHHILKYDLQENGALSSLPFLILMVTNPLSGSLADQLTAKDILSTKNTRKLLNSIGLLVPAALMLAVCLCERNRTVIVTLLTLAVGFSGFTMAGYSVNHLDIAPTYAGVLYAISNTVGTTSGFIGPAIVGALTNGKVSDRQDISKQKGKNNSYAVFLPCYQIPSLTI